MFMLILSEKKTLPYSVEPDNMPQNFKTIIIWALTRENLSSGVCDQQSLISAVVIRILEGIISELATGEISFF